MCKGPTLHFNCNCLMFPAGTYECGFTIGSIRHVGRTNLSVALLPDTITLSSMPLTVDCSENQAPVSITVSAIIPASDTTYDISWGYNGNVSRDVKKTSKIFSLNFQYSNRNEYIGFFWFCFLFMSLKTLTLISNAKYV